MRFELAHVTPRRLRLKSGPAQALVDEYVKRAGRYVSINTAAYESEAALLAAFEQVRGPRILVLLDSRGLALSSEGFAARLGGWRDGGHQQVTLAVGPADGWSDAARAQADLLFALGAVTLPHELALVVLAEQVYRAMTILAGHPYHGGSRK